MEEIRLTDESTGASKGTKVERHDLIPVPALRRLATHFGVGCKKYAENNWRRGYKWSWSYAALMRHLTAFWGGEDVDGETGSRHITCVAWHAMALDTFMDEHPDKDDRFVAEEPPTKKAIVQKSLFEALEACDDEYTGERIVDALFALGAISSPDTRENILRDYLH